MIVEEIIHCDNCSRTEKAPEYIDRILEINVNKVQPERYHENEERALHVERQ